MEMAKLTLLILVLWRFIGQGSHISLCENEIFKQITMTKIQKLKIAIPLIIFMLFFAIPVFAAEIYFDTKTQEIKVNQLFEVVIFINTDEESINAVEGKIVFPEKLLKLKEIRDGNSIINFWIERPRAKNGEILFSGIIPGGYMDKKGLIFSIIFQAIQEGRGSIEIRDIKALLNDGKGTKADTTISNSQFAISGQEPASRPAVFEKKDIDMPETFEPTVASDPAIFDGKYFLVFATQDKASGIDFYEVKESRQGLFSIFKSWMPVESPFVLNDQELRSFIFVKAIDKAGNKRIAVVEPRYPIKWYYEAWWIWIIIILAIIFTLIFIKRNLWNKIIH